MARKSVAEERREGSERTQTGSVVDVRDLGAVGNGVIDDTEALQRALDSSLASGRTVYLPDGRYRTTRPLQYRSNFPGHFTPALRMIGDGHLRSMIEVAHAGPGLVTDPTEATTGRHDHKLDFGLHLADFAIIGAHAQSSGWHLAGQWYGSIERVRIQGHGSDGIRILKRDFNPDWYGSAGLEFVNCLMTYNRGWGIRAEAGLNFIVVSIRRSYVVGNRSGGIQCNGGGLEIVGCGIAGNGGRSEGSSEGGGIHVRDYDDGQPNDTFVIEGCELDDNFEYHVRLDTCTTGAIRRNRFLSNVVEAEATYVTPLYGLWMPNGKRPVRSLDVSQNIWMAVDDMRAEGLRHEFIRFESEHAVHVSPRIRITGSMFRLHPGTVVNDNALIYTDDDVGGEAFPIPAGGMVRLRPIRSRGVALFTVVGRPELTATFAFRLGHQPALSPMHDVAKASLAFASEPAPSETVPTAAIQLRATTDGFLEIVNNGGAPIGDWAFSVVG